MHFQNQEFHFLLLLLPLFIGFYIYSSYRREKNLNLIVSNHLIPQLTRGFSYTKRNFKFFLLLLALSIYCIIIMRPQWGDKLIKVSRKGIDIVFVIDVSRSMMAEDILPNRLEKAKIQLTSFIDNLKGDRVGLVVFAGSSFVACPLTLDYNALKLFIDLLSPDMVNRQGTLIAEALQTARRCFNIKEKQYKAIVLLTDGEDHGSASIEEAKLCRKEGIRVYTIGLGKQEGEPIPLKNEEGETIDYLKDNRDKIVMSRLDQKALRQIALETKGEYVFSKYGELELDRIYQNIQGLDKKDLGSKRLRQKEDRFQYFIAVLLVILTLESLTNEKKKPINVKGRYE